MEIVLYVQVGLGPAVEGQDFQVAPFLVAKVGLPPLEVLGQTAQVDLAVDGAGAADDLALGDVYLALLVIDDAAQVPGNRRADGLALGRVAVADGFRQLLRVGVVLPRLQQQHRAVGVFRKPAGHHRTGGAAADYDNVVFHSHSS